MTKVIDGQGQHKTVPEVPSGLIIGYSGPRVPTGWGICDGTNGTPNLVDRFVIGDTAVGSGTAGGTASIETGLTHAGFALGNHDAHVVTQPSNHSAHSPTQPAAHSAHVATQPDTHPTHASGGAHTHNAHTTTNDGSLQVAGSKLIGPATHSSDGGHTHDAHPAHTGWGVNAHSAHSGFAVDAHSAHSGFAVDAHSVHSVTQADTHLLRAYKMVLIMKI